MSRLRWILSGLAVVLTLVFLVAEADARAGRGGSFGSRGSRTFTPPAATQTAPNQARPFERTMTQPGQPSTAATRTGATSPAGGFFNRPGLLGGLAAGFLGAGLLGLLFGQGLFGGLGGLASIFGLLLQVVLVVIVARLLWSWWQRRSQPQPAYAGGPSLRDAAPEAAHSRADLGGASSTSSMFAGGAVDITPADYDAFERLLGEVQGAYSSQDLSALRARVTPEMLSYFSEEFADYASRGVVNEVTNVKLEQGDLSEAWREGDTDYATVAMRYSLVDRTVERASGRVVEGSDTPQEVTELWTFRRSRGGEWMLSGIQQT
jgi:predicted lipid-binding transport protein (Tim44 family)